MGNERLRGCIAAAQLTVDDVATRASVDRKTVERWIATGRLPHRQHRELVATLLGTEETYLWPELLDDRRVRATSHAEFITLYPSRSAIPDTLWHALIDGANEHLDVLVFAGLFLLDGYPDLAQTLIRKAEDGVSVRLLLGDPTSDAVRLRGEEEGIGDGMAGRIQLSLIYLRPALLAPGIEVRFHTTTLYNSIFRFDDDMLVNVHAYGAPAAQSPAFHLRQLPGGRLFGHYLASFDRVWDQAKSTAA
jgi:Domain of unknown function (DUF5919)